MPPDRPPSTPSARQIFGDALERAAEEREAFVRDACAGDEALLGEVAALLEHHVEDDFLQMPAFAGARLDTGALDAAPTEIAPRIGEKPGDRIDRYKLLQQIGEGGIGVVFMAEQEAPVKRRVALKILKPGLDTKSVIARFESERQALALMDHPNIAKVLDAGATEVGRPYFVMDLVRGVAITEFCDQNRLSTRERLALFVDVCQAIQHAHQKGIIHRDIKPSNILVTLHDGKLVPKVIDFGIAKAIDQRLSDKTYFTEFQAFIGTPAYVSPEQAEMSGLDVDTRADIYSLGVLLYELLTGSTPFDGRELWSSGLDNMRRTIREDDPVAPSNRLRTLPAADQTTTAERRRTDAAKLTGLLRGDLDWIVLKALDKDRTRRYATATALAMDVNRHLNNEPVLARPPSASYRFRKLVRRNRLAVAAAGAFAAALTIGLAVSTWQFVEKSAALTRAVAAEKEQTQLRGEAEPARQAAESQSQMAQWQAYAADMNLAQAALATDNLGQARNLVSRYASASRDLLGWEWRYLWKQCQSDALFTLGEFDSEVALLGVSSDDKWVAIGQFREGGLSVWDLRARREIARFPEAGAFTFSPAEPILAYTINDRVRLWNVATGQILREIDAGDCRALTFSADGRRLLGICGTADVVTWEVATGEEVANVPIATVPNTRGYGIYGDRFVVTPDLRIGAQVINGNHIRVLDLTTGQERWRAKAADEHVSELALSPNGRLLATSAGFVESDIRLWDVNVGSEARRLKGHRTFVRSLAFSPNGDTLASGSADQTIKLWDASAHSALTEPLATLRGHRLEVWSLAFCSDGTTLVSGAKDGTALVWDTVRVSRDHRPARVPSRVLAWEFLPDADAIVALDDEGWLARFEGRGCQQRIALIDVGDDVRSVVFSSDGQLAATSSRRRETTIWDIAAGKPVRDLPMTSKGAIPVAFFHNDTVLRTSSPTGFADWEVATGKKIGQWAFDANAHRSHPAFTADGQAFASIGQGAVTLGRLEGDRVTLSEKLNVSQPSGLAFSRDGNLLAVASVLGHCELWDVSAAPKRVASFHGFLQGAHSVTFSPDGQRLAVGSNGNEAVKLWDLRSQRELLTLPGQGSMFDAIRFAPDGKLLAARNSQGELHLWQAPSEEETVSLDAGW